LSGGWKARRVALFQSNLWRSNYGKVNGGIPMQDFNLFWVVVLVIYFAPSIVGELRRHRNAMAINVVNIFLGWTLVGWVVALAWAFTDNVRGKPPKASDVRIEPDRYNRRVEPRLLP
jgi:hypothetical protein